MYVAIWIMLTTLIFIYLFANGEGGECIAALPLAIAGASIVTGATWVVDSSDI